MRILYAENHATFASVVVEQFLADHEVVVVPTVSGALARFDAERFDAVITDFDLDDGKGIEIVRAIRVRGLRVTIVGASSHEDGDDALIAAGADAVCSKMRFADIGRVVEECMARKR